MSLPGRFVRYIRRRRLIAAGERVLVAVSGGVDSVVLLHLFKTVAPELGIDVHAAHFDHAMRPESAGDAEWLEGLCETWEIPIIRARSDVPLSSEMDARVERYRFLTSAIETTASQKAATAHHADDQVETVLLRMLRGAGWRGLSGIPVRRGPFIRPLLRVSKTEISAYADAHGIRFREDASNQDLRFLRNRVRRSLVPALDEVTPAARASVLALARHAARTEAAWNAVLMQMERDVANTDDTQRIELARDVLLKYHPALRARVLRHFLRRFGVVPSRASTHHILRFCERAESGSVLQVAGRARIERAFDRLLLSRTAERVTAGETLTLADREGQARLNLGGAQFDVAWTHARAGNGEGFDADALALPLELRGWQPGDRIQLPYGTKKLKKLFGERRIPVSERARIPLVVDHHGHVLWIVGIARSVHALPTNAQTVLNLTVSNAELG